MSLAHKDLAEGRWNELSLMEQLGNVGSEVSRTIQAKKRGDDARAISAFERSLELFDLTLACPQNSGRCREITRAREFWVDFYSGSNQYGFTDQAWEEYFLQFGIAARRRHN